MRYEITIQYGEHNDSPIEFEYDAEYGEADIARFFNPNLHGEAFKGAVKATEAMLEYMEREDFIDHLEKDEDFIDFIAERKLAEAIEQVETDRADREALDREYYASRL